MYDEVSPYSILVEICNDKFVVYVLWESCIEKPLISYGKKILYC
jgi:hypothetical protein